MTCRPADKHPAAGPVPDAPARPLPPDIEDGVIEDILDLDDIADPLADPLTERHAAAGEWPAARPPARDEPQEPEVPAVEDEHAPNKTQRQHTSDDTELSISPTPTRWTWTAA